MVLVGVLSLFLILNGMLLMFPHYDDVKFMFSLMFLLVRLMIFPSIHNLQIIIMNRYLSCFSAFVEVII